VAAYLDRASCRRARYTVRVLRVRDISALQTRARTLTPYARPGGNTCLSRWKASIY
jgi:hypothetical protein